VPAVNHLLAYNHALVHSHLLVVEQAFNLLTSTVEMVYRADHDIVPIIDIANMEARRPEITQQLMTAASEIGFFRVKGEICSAFWCRQTLALLNSDVLESMAANNSHD